MAAPTGEFPVWLSAKLQALNPDIDLEVFVSYIQGVLETETDREDTIESISGLLAEVLEEDNLDSVCDEIICKWKTEEEEKTKLKEEADARLAENVKLVTITESQKNVPKQRVITKEERERKEAILRQYAEVSDGEEDDEDDDNTAGATGAEIFKNQNAENVDKTIQEKRLKMKQQHDEKKEKDKADREKQKQKAQDRKEAEKKRTQKGERRTR